MQSTTLLTRLGAGELARSIAAGDVLARAVVNAHIDRIVAVDRELNAVDMRRFEAVRREAGPDRTDPLAQPAQTKQRSTR